MKKALINLSAVFLEAMSMDSIIAMNNFLTTQKTGSNNSGFQEASDYDKKEINKFLEDIKVDTGGKLSPSLISNIVLFSRQHNDYMNTLMLCFDGMIKKCNQLTSRLRRKSELSETLIQKFPWTPEELKQMAGWNSSPFDHTSTTDKQAEDLTDDVLGMHAIGDTVVTTKAKSMQEIKESFQNLMNCFMRHRHIRSVLSNKFLQRCKWNKTELKQMIEWHNSPFERGEINNQQAKMLIDDIVSEYRKPGGSMKSLRESFQKLTNHFSDNKNYYFMLTNTLLQEQQTPEELMQILEWNNFSFRSPTITDQQAKSLVDDIIFKSNKDMIKLEKSFYGLVLCFKQYYYIYNKLNNTFAQHQWTPEELRRIAAWYESPLKYTDITNQQAKLIIDNIVSAYKKDKNTKKLEKSFQKLMLGGIGKNDDNCFMLSNTFLQNEWTAEELYQITVWPNSPFLNTDMTNQQAKLIIDNIVFVYKKDKNMEKLMESFELVQIGIEKYYNSCFTLNNTFLQCKWTDEELYQIALWRESPFKYIDMTIQQANQIINKIVFIYKKDGNMKKSGESFQKLISGDIIRDIFFTLSNTLLQHKWTNEELYQIALWRESPFKYINMTIQQAQQIINSIVFAYEKDEDMKIFEESFQNLVLGGIGENDRATLSRILLQNEWTDEELYQIAVWHNSPFANTDMTNQQAKQIIKSIVFAYRKDGDMKIFKESFQNLVLGGIGKNNRCTLSRIFLQRQWTSEELYRIATWHDSPFANTDMTNQQAKLIIDNIVSAYDMEESFWVIRGIGKNNRCTLSRIFLQRQWSPEELYQIAAWHDSPFANTDMTNQQAKLIIDNIVSAYKKDKNIEKLEKSFQNLVSMEIKENNRCALSDIFLQHEWTDKELRQIATWRPGSPFVNTDMTNQQAKLIIDNIVSAYKKDKNIEKLRESFKKLMLGEITKNNCFTLSDIFLQCEWTDKELDKIAEWDYSPFHYMVIPIGEGEPPIEF